MSATLCERIRRVADTNRKYSTKLYLDPIQTLSNPVVTMSQVYAIVAEILNELANELETWS